jgi:hypothetical protein
MLARAEVVAADEGSYARVRIERSPLAPGNALVSLQSWVGWGTTSIRHREWRFALAPAGPEIELRTREVVRGGFSGAAGPQPDELVARAIARRLDWNVPERDAGRAEY